MSITWSHPYVEYGWSVDLTEVDPPDQVLFRSCIMSARPITHQISRDQGTDFDGVRPRNDDSCRYAMFQGKPHHEVGLYAMPLPGRGSGRRGVSTCVTRVPMSLWRRRSPPR